MAGRTRTNHWVVLDGWEIRPLLQRSVKAGERHNETRGLQPRGRPDVPRKSHAIAVFALMNELLISRHAKLEREAGLALSSNYIDFNLKITS